MLSLGVHGALAQSNPLDVTCGAVKTYFNDAACCGTPDKALGLPDVCPSLDVQISYPAKAGIYTPCPAEEVYYKFMDTNPSAPGYAGCVSEAGFTPCGGCALGTPCTPPPAQSRLKPRALTALPPRPPPSGLTTTRTT